MKNTSKRFSTMNMLTIFGVIGLIVYAIIITSINNNAKSVLENSDQASQNAVEKTRVAQEVKNTDGLVITPDKDVTIDKTEATKVAVTNPQTKHEEIIVKQTDANCINVKDIYEQANVISKGTTGVDQSIDTLKRNDLAATLITLTGVVYGNEIYCMDAASRSSLTTTERRGILGSIEDQVYSMATNTPTIDVISHFKQEFLPGENKQNTGAYAQSLTSNVTGYQYLKDQMKLDLVWNFFRNIAYVGFVIVMIVTGFMIMFRSKISGQIYVSVTNSLPNIVLGLVLVTFSFAIVGLVLDGGKLLMNVTQSSLQPVFQSQGVSMVGIQSIGDIYGGAMDVANPNSGLELAIATGAFAGAEAVLYTNVDVGFPGLDLIADGIDGAAKIVSAGIKIAAVGDILKILIIGAICLYAAVKIFFTLLVTYLKLFLDLILAPIYILMGTFPGNSHMISDWFKRLISYSLTFVIVFLILNLSRYIALSTNVTVNSLNFFGTSTGIIGWFIPVNAIIVIVSYLIASTAPSLVNSFMDIKASQGMTQILGDVKKSAGKLPVVGGMFGS